MDDSVKFLSQIYDLLVEGNVFETRSNEQKSIVNFKHPTDMKNLLSLSLANNVEPNEDDSQVVKLCQDVIKFSVKTNNQNFHNQLFGGLDFYGLGADWITSALNSSQYTYEMAPTFTLIEQEVIRMSLKVFGFEEGDGIMCPGGSAANMYGIHVARFAKFPTSKIEGNPSGLVMFTSDDSHYSMKKGASLLGIGMQNLISVKTNEFGQMIGDDLMLKIDDAIKKNLKPFFVNATCGSTVLGAFDDLNKISVICKKYGLWLHADCCLGGSAVFSSRRRHLLKGIERVDSISWNPHKTLGAPMQCSIFLVNHKGLVQECNSSSANYLFQQDKFYDTSYDTGDKSLSCGRKIDAFKFWLMWKKRGTHGFERLIDNAFDMADYLAEQIRTRPGFELLLPHFEYTNVCFFYIPKYMEKKETRDEKWWKNISTIVTLVKEQMMMDGNLMVGYSPLPHKNIGNFFRMVVTCHPPATNESMDFVLKQIEEISEKFEFHDQF